MSKQYQVGDVVENMGDVGGFHAREHLFFNRLPNGDVRVQNWTKEKPFTLMSETVVDAHTWASIVASVSFLGEDAVRYRHIIEFHEQRP